MAEEIYAKLVAIGIDQSLDPELLPKLTSHFGRLPPSYALDATVDKATTVLVHMRLLAEAESTGKHPAFHCEMLRTETENSDHGRSLLGGLLARQEVTSVPVYEITFSCIDSPKLLSKLSSLLADIGLNIREAHTYLTLDGYSLDVFAVDGWPHEDTDGLDELIGETVTRYEEIWKILSTKQNTRSWEIDLRLLTLGETVVSDTSGDLYHGTYRGEDVSIKAIKFLNLTDFQLVRFVQEGIILRKCVHPNVVRFVGACIRPSKLCIVTEHMPGGRLYDFLHKHPKPLDLCMLLKFALDVCKGMDYLHQSNIIHRDLKTSNLLLDKNHVIKVANFGLARFCHNGCMTPRTGTYKWMAPEIISSKRYTPKADIFSFAIVLWELATLNIPYDRIKPLQVAVGVIQGHRPKLPVNVDHRLSNLIQRCWDEDPDRRPTFNIIRIELEEMQNEIQGENISRASE